MRLNKGKEVILAIGDTQYPFEHPDTFAFLRAIKKKWKPTKVIHIGDSIDANNFSTFLSDPQGLSPIEEYKQAKERLEEQYDIFPTGVEVYSNHVARIELRRTEAGLLPEFMKPLKEILCMPDGWDLQDYVIIDDIRFEHGDRAGGMYAAKKLESINRRSTVIGHHHSYGGIQYQANDEFMTFAANAGCLIDIKSYAFKYGNKFPHKPTLGSLIINHGVPHFIPMIINDEGRWIGEIM